MYITKEQKTERLNKTEVLIEEKSKKGFSNPKLSPELKELIGTLSHFDTQVNVAEAFGVKQPVVSRTAMGLSHSSFDPELKNKIDNNVADKKGKIQEQVLTNLADALTNVGLKMAQTDASEASKIAVDMGKLLDRVNGESGGKKMAIIINVPNQRTGNSYAAIDV